MSGLRVFAIADTHLGAAAGKTMDRFGEAWRGHAEKIAENCARLVGPNDVLLLPGDLSWAMRREDALPDLAFLASLPGRKIAIKGNHDYWWPSGKRLDFPGLVSPPVVFAPSFAHLVVSPGSSPAHLGIAGTRSWFVPTPGSPDEAADRKILERERLRLRRSLEAIAECRVKIAMTHYSPHPYLAELREASVAAVAYGHLHLGSPPEAERQAHDGETVEGVPLFCVACDRIGFAPRLLGEF